MALYMLYSVIGLLIFAIEILKSPSVSPRLKSTIVAVVICYLPLAATAITFYLCYTNSFAEHRFPDWCVTPWISYMGVYNPSIFAYGLSSVALLCLVVHYVFIKGILLPSELLLPSCTYLPKFINGYMDWMLVHNTELAAINIVIVGWVNVDDALTQEFLSTEIQNMNWFRVGWKAVVHVSGVLIFFALLQAQNITIVLRWNPRYGNSCREMRDSKRFKIGIICAIGGALVILYFALVYVAFLADTKSEQGLKDFYTAQNVIGFMQYVAVFGYGTFWASFGYDYVMMTTIGNDAKKRA